MCVCLTECVYAIVAGMYNSTGQLVNDTSDINCTDRFNFCSSAKWANNTWAMGNLPDMNDSPPEKDTIIVPTGESEAAR